MDLPFKTQRRGTFEMRASTWILSSLFWLQPVWIRGKYFKLSLPVNMHSGQIMFDTHVLWTAFSNLVFLSLSIPHSLILSLYLFCVRVELEQHDWVNKLLMWVRWTFFISGLFYRRQALQTPSNLCIFPRCGFLNNPGAALGRGTGWPRWERETDVHNHHNPQIYLHLQAFLSLQRQRKKKKKKGPRVLPEWNFLSQSFGWKRW